ncbi:HD domain-containing protein [Maritimibacter fusiformis]|uniref:HD domain-containing protein n=1 Tax=Maritimibacter fusiformis TaxID=2603819 RepID=UPI0011DCE1B4|nr:HD domain-containing protein [Maritimibacter fusiformis]
MTTTTTTQKPTLSKLETGQPSDLALDRPRDLHRAIGLVGNQADAARGHIAAFCDLWPEASLQDISLQEANKLSWWLAGVRTVVDWIGSNTVAGVDSA